MSSYPQRATQLPQVLVIGNHNYMVEIYNDALAGLAKIAHARTASEAMARIRHRKLPEFLFLENRFSPTPGAESQQCGITLIEDLISRGISPNQIYFATWRPDLAQMAAKTYHVNGYDKADLRTLLEDLKRDLASKKAKP
jgi:hypothetical protein